MPRRNPFFRNLIAGFLMGIGCVLPGISGGVMAVSFGLYQPMLDAVLNVFHNTRKRLSFLLPIALGGIVGVVLASSGLSWVMQHYNRLTLFLFTGFILGGLPQLWREMGSDGRFNPRCLWYVLLGVLLALPFSFIGGQGQTVSRLSPMQSLITGLLEGFGTIVPGVSTSFLLIRLGWYQAYLNALRAVALDQLWLMAVGFSASALASMKAIEWLFAHARAKAYGGVLGFLLVSVALVFPGWDSGSLFWADCALLAAGAVIAGGIHPSK